MSAMWSASSRTVISTSREVAGAALDQVDEAARGGDEQSTPRSQRADLLGRTTGRRRPGRMRRAERRGRAASARRATCMASSRVGTRIRPAGGAARRGRGRPSRASIGRPKASVLPEPVWPRPRTSRPASASGMVAAWIGNGVGDAVPAQSLDQFVGQAEGLERHAGADTRKGGEDNSDSSQVAPACGRVRTPEGGAARRSPATVMHRRARSSASKTCRTVNHEHFAGPASASFLPCGRHPGYQPDVTGPATAGAGPGRSVTAPTGRPARSRSARPRAAA